MKKTSGAAEDLDNKRARSQRVKRVVHVQAILTGERENKRVFYDEFWCGYSKFEFRLFIELVYRAG